jgi:hypothetical protein
MRAALERGEMEDTINRVFLIPGGSNDDRCGFCVVIPLIHIGTAIEKLLNFWYIVHRGSIEQQWLSRRIHKPKKKKRKKGGKKPHREL